jgi:transcriptional regulator with XRE-family HTH domain
MTTISKNLKKLREAKTPYLQNEFAELIGVKQSTYSTWESGSVDVKSEFIPKIASLLGVEIKDLFETVSTKIKISQNNTDNKDNSINGLIFVVADEKSIEKIVSVLKENINQK